MGVFTIRRVLALFAVIWIGTLVYIWFPYSTFYKNSQKKNVPDRSLRLQKFLAKSNASDVVHVAMTTSNNTLGAMVTAVNSIFLNSKHNVVFHLVTDKQSLRHARKWLETHRISMEIKRHKELIYEIIPFPEHLLDGKIKVWSGRKELANPLNYARYYLPRLFPDIKGRLVFIDDDCIVQGDIWELSRMQFKHGHFISFSEDCSSASRRITLMKNNYADYLDLKNVHLQKLKIDPLTCAFNTGVYVVDTRGWRRHNITQQLEYWLRLNTKEEVYGNEKGGGGSQPPMMIVFYKNYTPLDPLWHVRFLGWTAGTSYSSKFIASAKLLHWNGRFKPWGRVSQHSTVWDKYYLKDPLGQFNPVRRMSH